MSRVLLLAACAAGVFALALGSAGRVIAADSPPAPPFAVGDIFAPENRAEIYADCPNARDAAEFLSKHAETTSPDEAVGAQQFFLNCVGATRAWYNASTTRYLLLALAAATYLEAKGTTGTRHAEALKRGQAALDRVLPRAVSTGLGVAPITVVPQPNVAGHGMTSSNNGNGRPTLSGQQQLTISGGRPTWRFAPFAYSLRDAYDALLLADGPAAATTGTAH